MLLEAGSTLEGGLLKIFDTDSFSFYRIDLLSYDVSSVTKSCLTLCDPMDCSKIKLVSPKRNQP